VKNTYDDTQEPGAIEVSTKEVTTKNGTPIVLQLLDTVGGEKFYSLGSAQYQGVSCCVLVCDLTSQSSFEHLPQWITDFQMLSGAKDTTSIPIVLVANKVDEGQQRQVHFKRLQAWSQENPQNNIKKLLEVSAQDNVGIDEAFQAVAELCLQAQVQAASAQPPVDPQNAPRGDKGKSKCIIL